MSDRIAEVREFWNRVADDWDIQSVQITENLTAIAQNRAFICIITTPCSLLKSDTVPHQFCLLHIKFG